MVDLNQRCTGPDQTPKQAHVTPVLTPGMRAHLVWIAGGIVLGMLVSGFASAVTVANSSTATSIQPANVGPVLTTLKSNWAGYFVHTFKTHTVTDVKGSWIVPKLKTWCKTVGTSSVFMGIGMDDVGSSATSFEILGIVSSCSSSGRSNQLYQGFTTTSVSLGGYQSFKVAPGTVISAEIKFQSGQLYYSLTNHNTSKAYHHAYASSYSKHADRQTAEWFSTQSALTPYLAPYGTAEFGPKYTHLNHSDEVNITGTTRAIGSHSNLFATDEVRGTILLALHGALASDKRSFVLTWKHR